MRQLVIAIIAGVILLVPAGPAHAGTQTTHFSFNGQSAQASFHSVDGCADTLVTVFASDGPFKEDGDPATQSRAGVIIDTFDVCTNTQLFLATGDSPLTREQFQIDDDITSASLNATIEVTDDVSGSTFPVNATINWIANGTLFSFKNHLIQIQGPGVLINARFNATLRLIDIPPGSGHAEGVVTDGVTYYASGPAYLGILSSRHSGRLDLTPSRGSR